MNLPALATTREVIPGLGIRFPKLKIPSALTVVGACSIIWPAASSTVSKSTSRPAGTTPPSVPLTTIPLISDGVDWAFAAGGSPGLSHTEAVLIKSIAISLKGQANNL